MRLEVRFAVALLLAASAVFAQERKTEISVFAADLGYSESRATGSNFTGGVGVSLNQWWTSRISTEFGVTAEKHFTYSETDRQTVYRYPIDAVAQYHFLNNSRWQPYLGVGARAGDRVVPEINGGVLLQFTPRFGLRLDVRQLQDQTTSEFHESLTRFSIGLGWSF